MRDKTPTNSPKKHSELAQVGRFGLVGILNTVVDFIVFNVIVWLVAGMPLEWAGIISGTAAMINSFVFNKNFTFKTKKLNTFKLVMFFIITAIGLYAIRPIIINFFTKVWLWPSQVVYDVTRYLKLPFTQDFDKANMALVISILVVLVYNYLFYKYYICKDEK